MKYLALIVLIVFSSCGRLPTNKSIVQLVADNGSSCTGFEIKAPSGKDYLITAGHCAQLSDNNGSITVLTEYGARLKSRIIALDTHSDLLLLESAPGLSPLSLANEDHPGESIRIIGHGFGLPLWEVDGKIIGEAQMVDWLETICSGGAMPGHSGSPVLDPDGRIVGVLSTSNSFVSGFVRLEDLKAFLKGY